MQHTQFVNQIKSQFFPVVIIEGDDAFLREDALAQTKDALDVKLPELNTSILIGEETSVNEIIALANSFPVMSEKRLVIVKDFLAEKKSVSKSDKSLQKLLDYCNDPNYSTCLVFFYNQTKCPLLLNATVVDCNKKELPAVSLWIKETFEKSKKTIKKLLADRIAEYSNCDMYKVSLSVSKLIAFCQEEITDEAIELLVPKDLEVVVFDLSNAICAKKPQTALEICKKLLIEDDSKKILGSLYSTFRRMFFTTTSNLSDDLLAEKLSVNAYALSKIKQQATKFGSKKLKHAMHLCANSDLAIKVFFANDKDVLSDLVLELCNL